MSDHDDHNGAPPPLNPGLAVLVVDDDAVNRDVVRRMLDRLGHRPVGADSGAAAITAADATGFDLILMDRQMPGMDGTEAARRIIERCDRRFPPPRIVAMTAASAADLWTDCAAAGMTDILRKPVRVEDLRRVLSPAPPLATAAGRQPQPVQASGDHLDEALLARNVDLLGLAEMVHLARLFQTSSRQMMAALDRAVAAGDRHGIRRLAHTLRSSSGPLGLVGLAECTRVLEGDAASAPFAALATQTAQVGRSRRAALEALWALRRTQMRRWQVSPEGTRVTVGGCDGVGGLDTCS